MVRRDLLGSAVGSAVKGGCWQGRGGLRSASSAVGGGCRHPAQQLLPAVGQARGLVKQSTTVRVRRGGRKCGKTVPTGCRGALGWGCCPGLGPGIAASSRSGCRLGQVLFSPGVSSAEQSAAEGQACSSCLLSAPCMVCQHCADPELANCQLPALLGRRFACSRTG